MAGRRAESLGLLRSRSVHRLEIYSYGELLGKEAEVLGADDHLLAELPLLIEHARRGIFDLPRAVSGTVPLDARAINGVPDSLERYSSEVRTVIVIER